MNPLVAGGLIAGAGELLSGIFGGSSSSSAGKAQLQATRETNEMNYKIWQEQRQAGIDMWNMQNEYNDPSAQMERLRNAGLNPYMAMANASNPAGVASSAPSTGQAPTMQTADSSAFQLQAQGNPWYGVFQGLSEGAMNFGNIWSTMTNAQTNKDVGNSQIGLNNANKDFVLIRKDWAPKLWEKEIQEKDSRISLNNIAYEYERDTFQTRKDILSASLTGMQLSNENRRIQNEYLPMEKQIALGLQVQQMANMIATEHLTYAQAKESLTRSILNSAQANLANSQSKYYGAMTENVEIDTNQKQLDYNTASRLAEDYIQTALAQNAYQRAMAISNTPLDSDLNEIREFNSEASRRSSWANNDEQYVRSKTANSERKYYNGPFGSIYHWLDKAKQYSPFF